MTIVGRSVCASGLGVVMMGLRTANGEGIHRRRQLQSGGRGGIRSPAGASHSSRKRCRVVRSSPFAAAEHEATAAIVSVRTHCVIINSVRGARLCRSALNAYSAVSLSPTTAAAARRAERKGLHQWRLRRHWRRVQQAAGRASEACSGGRCEGG